MGGTHPPGPALVTAAADADPVTLLVLGWLAAKQAQNTRTGYARDIGITPQRRASRAPSWLAWCREQAVHPVTGVTGLHVARYARQLDTAGLSPATTAGRTPPRHPGRPARRHHQPPRTPPDTALIPGAVPRCGRPPRDLHSTPGHAGPHATQQYDHTRHTRHTWHRRSTGSLVADGPARECWLTRRAAFSPGWATPLGDADHSVDDTTPQSTPSAAWCLRIASSSGPSSRQYTWPSGLWYSSTCRTPNSSARSWHLAGKDY